MSDRYSRLLADYANEVTWADLPPGTVHQVKRRVVDVIGVGMAAFAQDAPKVVRAHASAFPTQLGACLWGTSVKASPEMAALANGVMARYLDFNDTYLSREPLHPSDVIPALMALAEWGDRPPRALVTAIAVAYEVAMRLCDAASLRSHGWDHVNYIAIGVACGAGNLLRLAPEKTEHAIAMASVPHAAMRQTRAGELSMWKGVAAANAARNAVFATLLAWRGMTGPFRPFEGEMGFFRQLLGGEPFDEAALRPLEAKAPPTRIRDSHLKFWPVEYHAQSAVDAALHLRSEVGDPARIEAVHIDTFKAAHEIIARDPEKWAPKTRETADHSLPYIVAVALLDGQVSARSFSMERIAAPDVAELLKRTTLREDPELTQAYPEGIPNRITVRVNGGGTFAREVRYPRGHARNPMTDAEVEQKLRANVEGVWTREQADRVLGMLWAFEQQASVGALVEAMRV